MAETVIPYEGTVRAWLARARVSEEDIDDIVQEAYCRLAALDTVDHITRPGAYFFSIVRNLLLQRIKRSRIVSIDMIAEIETYAIDDSPSPEREAAGRLDYARLRAIMAGLPERCRRIVEMRKIEGISQKEIARRVGVTESVVENDVYHGVQTILRIWRDEDSRVTAWLNGTQTGKPRIDAGRRS
ncbi:RNA polymerase sigma factor [Sphingomonas sp. Sphisp140]|uniref:RNA polymerase sigma factor n=1 Tax=unclassified Sphingomonas TaxID=196159 RepID=UPI0039B00F94